MAWVDRPQGLLLPYRLVAATAWDPTARLLAMAAAALVTGSLAAGAWALAGRRAALIAAFTFAVVSPAPHLEGFTGNGELLAAAFTTGAVAAVLWWSRTADRRLLVVAGFLAAVGPLVKQSAVDGLVVVLVVVVVTAWPRRRHVRQGLLLVLAGAAVPVGAALLHAATIGWSDYWFAMVGHRSQTDSLIHGPFARRLDLFTASLIPFARDLAVLVPLAVAGAVWARGRRLLAGPGCWLLAAAAGFAVGGLYHPHYWMQLAPPLVLLAALGLEAIWRRRPRLALTAALAAVAVPLVLALPVYLAATNTRVAEMTFDDPRVTTAQPLADLVDALSEPGDRVAVVWANAAVYWHADRPPPFRYMWLGPLSQIDGAAADAAAVITGPDPVEMVVVSTEPDQLDPDGAVARALRTRYRIVGRVGLYPVYRLRTSLPRPPSVT